MRQRSRPDLDGANDFNRVARPQRNERRPVASSPALTRALESMQIIGRKR
jgi:hypothetical protein